MYRYSFLRLGQADAAEETVQEALLHALLARRSFQHRSSERTWIIGILRHKVIDRIRSDARRRAVEGSELIGGPLLLADGAAAERDLEQGELRAALLNSIAALPELMRQALCLRVIDQLSTEQVCEVLGITPTNLWTLVHRAKLRLRDELGDWLVGDEVKGEPSASSGEASQ